jgi:hypothetical protein
MQEEKSGMFPDSEDPELARVDGSLIDSDWNAGAPPDESAEENAAKAAEKMGRKEIPDRTGRKPTRASSSNIWGGKLDVSGTS